MLSWVSLSPEEEVHDESPDASCIIITAQHDVDHREGKKEKEKKEEIEEVKEEMDEREGKEGGKGEDEDGWMRDGRV